MGNEMRDRREDVLRALRHGYLKLVNADPQAHVLGKSSYEIHNCYLHSEVCVVG